MFHATMNSVTTLVTDVTKAVTPLKKFDKERFLKNVAPLRKALKDLSYKQMEKEYKDHLMKKYDKNISGR